MNTIDIPSDPTIRWEWIKFQLRARGLSLADVARSLEVTSQAVKNAKHAPYPRVERAIASALELNPSEIWPERWTSDGTSRRRKTSQPAS